MDLENSTYFIDPSGGKCLATFDCGGSMLHRLVLWCLLLATCSTLCGSTAAVSLEDLSGQQSSLADRKHAITADLKDRTR